MTMLEKDAFTKKKKEYKKQLERQRQGWWQRLRPRNAAATVVEEKPMKQEVLVTELWRKEKERIYAHESLFMRKTLLESLFRVFFKKEPTKEDLAR